MFEAISAPSGLGFSPIDYVAMWSEASTASRRTSAFAPTQAQAPLNSFAPRATNNAGSAGLFATSTEESDIQVELAIARMRAAAAQVQRNQSTQLAAGGANIRGGASFTYAVGPDGQLYATGVNLAFDTAPIAGDPQGTIAKMQQVRAAALATTSPSAADFAAAAAATQAELQARLELSQQLAQQYLSTSSGENSDLQGSLLDTFA